MPYHYLLTPTIRYGMWSGKLFGKNLRVLFAWICQSVLMPKIRSTNVPILLSNTNHLKYQMTLSNLAFRQGSKSGVSTSLFFLWITRRDTSYTPYSGFRFSWMMVFNNRNNPWLDLEYWCVWMRWASGQNWSSILSQHDMRSDGGQEAVRRSHQLPSFVRRSSF